MTRKISFLRALVLVVLTAIATLVALNLFTSKDKQIRQPFGHQYAVEDPQFLRAMGVLLGPPLVAGNRVDTLLNGDEIFPAMLAAIRSARRTINFETYIYWSGRIGAEFAQALAERARNGVKVHVLLDWIGSQKMDAGQVQLMREAGVEIQKFHPLAWYDLDRVNNRTHRKLLVVDGRVGFTGGVGIADEWNGHAQDENHWRDTHFRLEGPAVAQMQATFDENWAKVAGVVLHGDAYLPPLEPAGTQLAQVFHSSPEGGAESMHLMYMLSIASAARTIDLAMAYFVPDDLTLETLEAALRRGVRVRLLLPGPHTDAKTVRSASRAKWGRMLAAGAQIWEFQPTLFHCKVMVVDGMWSSVGSTNFDVRSFQLNDEANLNVFDARFAERLRRDFENDMQRSRRVTYEQWAARSWREKLLERFAGLFEGQL